MPNFSTIAMGNVINFSSYMKEEHSHKTCREPSCHHRNFLSHARWEIYFFGYILVLLNHSCFKFTFSLLSVTWTRKFPSLCSDFKMIYHSGQASNTAVINNSQYLWIITVIFISSSLDYRKFADDFALCPHSKAQTDRPGPMWKSDHDGEEK